ncbi:MAG: Na+/H+ antiporter subunit E [Deltaproteobacteria bacterium]|nr:Na+/H+ antiporter subunit E [Deltaproteobacteria bacterium]MBW2418728.1 Na+/H+ antiporter subunit E [Deltaproteobacteria bacterium]
MSTFFYMLLAGVVWMALRQSIDPLTFGVGAVIGALMWRVFGAPARRSFSPLRALRFAWISLGLLLVFLWELGVANVEQLRVIFAPRIDVRPYWVDYRSELETHTSRALLGLMIAMTPGSITCEEIEELEAGDRVCHVRIHLLNSLDPEAQLERIRKRLEAPLLKLEQL